MKTDTLYRIFVRNPRICTDSRNVDKRSIFFALEGDTFNGNQFAAQALEKGSSYAVVDEKKYAIDDRYILVDDVLSSLQQLALFHRMHFNIPVIAITGTNGKTTTKELMNRILKQKYHIVATHGNLNNHIGVPLSLLKIEKNTEIAIIEMGANHRGEIAKLCEFALPTHGMITNIGSAHLEGFGNLETIIRTKTELYEHLGKKDGTIFINRGNEILTDRLSQIRCEKIWYGGKSGNWSGIITNAVPTLELKVALNADSFTVKTNMFGAYNLENVLAAMSIGSYFNVEVEKMIGAVEGFIPSDNRSQIVNTPSNRLICDAYNANPTSMKLVIDDFLLMDSERKVLILGDMFELGENTEKEHLKLIKYVKDKSFSRIFLIGKIFSTVNQTLQIPAFIDVDSFVKWLDKNPIKSSYILLKGSRGMKLEKIIDYL